MAFNFKIDVTHAYGIAGVLVGIVGIVLTIIYSQSQESAEALMRLGERGVKEELNELLSRKTVVLTEKDELRTEAPAFPESTSESYLVLEVRQIWDMRRWEKIPSIDLIKPTSPVTVVVEKKLKKIKSQNTYLTSAYTSGYDVYTHCDTHPTGCRTIVSEGRVPVGENILKKRVTVMDTSKEDVGAEFYVKYTRTFWNAFQNVDQSWVGVIAEGAIKRISFLLVLPDRKIFDNPKLMVAKIGSRAKYEYRGEKIVLEDPDGRWMYWEILHPQANYVYRIDWNWNF